MMYGTLENGLCDMQGKLFEMSAELGYDSENFMKVFMRSDLARKLDSDYNYLQWAGKEYIMETLEEKYGDVLTKGGLVFSQETMYWAGYTYRKWHYYKSLSSKEIYKIANARRINSVFYAYHCMDVEMAIDRLSEKTAKTTKNIEN